MRIATRAICRGGVVEIANNFRSRPMWFMVSTYSDIAPGYDCTVGLPFSRQVRDGFEKLAQRYGIRFCSAADLGCGTGLFACYLNLCWGVPVYAVDNSAAMLRQAHRNCRGAS